MNLLIAYASTDGMTAQIAQHLGEVAGALGHRAEVLNMNRLSRRFDPRRFDAILLGASVHVRGYQRSAKHFIRKNLEALNSRPSAFFSVCMAIASKDERSRGEARAIAKAFPAAYGWKPDVIEVMAGAIMFSRYGIFRRPVMRAIARKEVGELDTSRDYVYTDWNAVDRFCRSFLEAAARRLAAVPVRSTEAVGPSDAQLVGHQDRRLANMH